MILNIVYTLGGVVLGAAAIIFFYNGRNLVDLEKRKAEAEDLIKRSLDEAEKLKTETLETVDKFKKNSETEISKKEERLEKIKKALDYKEENIKKREEKNNEIKLQIASEKEAFQALQESIKNSDGVVLEKLSAKAGQGITDLKEAILNEQKENLERENAEKLKYYEEKTKEDSNKIAKKIVISTMQRLCSATSVETRSVHVKVPREHIKGKIVGKNGKNIEAFEELMPDVAIVFNDLPNTISLSCFNLVNRRIAQRAMEKLVKHRGDINKEIIMREMSLSEKEVDAELYEIGKKAVDKMGFRDFDKDLVRIIGRLKYRTSYGQNIMKHSMEVAWVATMLGSEIGLDIETCKVGGFLHDLGKAIDQDPNEKDAHDKITKELMEKHGFSWEEVHAAWTHHNAIAPETAEALIVQAADAVSAGRPGARQESIVSYGERIQAIEETTRSFKGVKKVFTMSAGREVRVMVNPEMVSDEDIKNLAEQAAERIEEELKYPGKIKINVIRRIKTTDIAKVK